MTRSSLSKRPTLMQSGLNFSQFGYFTRPMTAGTGKPNEPEWLALEARISALKGGDFSVVGDILAACRASEDWRFKEAAAKVLGHAGSSSCYRDMRAELQQLPLRAMEWVDIHTRETILMYCAAFASWGRLDVVPVLLDFYVTLRLKKTHEIAMLPIYMYHLLTCDPESMIGSEPPDDMLEDYFSLVMTEYEDAVARLKSDKVFVDEGELQSVRKTAERMLPLAMDYASVELRRLRARFEPATGIDCSAVFDRPEVSLIEASAIAQAFLDSPSSAGFEPGARYFFGHLVPD